MKKILNQLFNHQKLTRAEAREILVNISNEVYNEAQIAAFMTVYLMRPISVEELSGFLDALLELCRPAKFDGQKTIDLCGTGGDGKNTFNISTLSAFVVAGAGYKVTKHGNYGVSSTCGSSNVLEHLGYEFSNDNDRLKKQLDHSNICFLHAPLFHPAMKAVAPIRRQLGIKTFFNMLGPLVNPARPHYQLVGVFNLELARIYHYIFQNSTQEYSIVHALDGYDEISLTGNFKVKSNDRDVLLSPAQLGMRTLRQEELFGGDTVPEAAKIFTNILEGNGTEAQVSAVSANAGLAIHTIKSAVSLLDCIAEAKESITSKNALTSFKKLLS